MGERSQLGAEPPAQGVCPVLQAKPFAGCDAAGRAPSPHVSLLGLQSDFLAGFLLFHITTMIKTPATRQKNRFSQKTSNYGHF